MSVTVDWLSVGTWFGTFSALGARMCESSLVHPLFVARKESRCNMVSKTMQYVTAMTCKWALSWRRHPCGALSYFYQKGCACWEVRLAEVGLYTSLKGVGGYY